MFQKEDGFTLIESLMVLLIVSALLFIPVLSIHKITEEIQVNLAFKELETSITLMQNHALLAKQRTAVQLLPSQNTFQFRVYDGSPYGGHALDHQINFDEEVVKINKNKSTTIYFIAESGDIKVSDSDGWTTKFSTSQGAYELVFQLGSGRFEIRKR